MFSVQRILPVPLGIAFEHLTKISLDLFHQLLWFPHGGARAEGHDPDFDFSAGRQPKFAVARAIVLESPLFMAVPYGFPDNVARASWIRVMRILLVKTQRLVMTTGESAEAPWGRLMVC